MDELKEYKVRKIEYSKILICVDSDDFESSKNAFNYACSLAKHYNSELGIVSVLETGDLNIFQSLDPEVLAERREEIKELLEVYGQKAKEYGVKDVHMMVTEGGPGTVIVDKVIPKFQPDLVIVGVEKKNRNRNTIGSQASKIVNSAGVSVSVIR
ncbi:universal stress protein UspA family protein [Companilactobacillus paralimentarius DSM 13238 = JCM 10415]|jgi:Universal stress protein UspA and related nucleotide-binding proteins|uniref:UspA domain-containing protein n=3 Tax=Companilactobacillus TaxID=2767879 RepID=A0A202F924_9LACO|nr:MULTISPECIES: universal stress protein [Companilactobacillus]KAE9561436.1 universal stress protein UspA [Companilactobacillus bobalius]KAE9563474.1 universal stress protein UspA [Companilactobacillus paralimentarius]KRK82326.1 universal stress protein UspA family protein [Companilactobacillus bobalius DSM 19674]KRL29952.1 universal stress protein UspA family protein [Companilactobacillus paralimentarius DSM 13238 = JCM 10415]MDR4932438.1 universal stress protein [Companilactobacillus parali